MRLASRLGIPGDRQTAFWSYYTVGPSASCYGRRRRRVGGDTGEGPALHLINAGRVARLVAEACAGLAPGGESLGPGARKGRRGC